MSKPSGKTLLDEFFACAEPGDQSSVASAESVVRPSRAPAPPPRGSAPPPPPSLRSSLAPPPTLASAQPPKKLARSIPPPPPSKRRALSAEPISEGGVS